MSARGRLPRELPEAFALAANGFTMAQIARELDVAYWTVNYWAQRNGITLAQYKHSLKPAALRAIELAKEGCYPAEIARQTGMTHGGITKLLEREGVVAGKCGGKPATVERAQKMASMFRQGLTLVKIGEHFNLTRERVRQVLKRLGITAEHGGQSKIAATKKQDAQAKRDAKSFALWGLSHAEMAKWRSAGLVKAFVRQELNAKLRGVAWNLSFTTWLGIWLESGKLEMRGRGKGRYVMSRIKDEGGYRIGNVHIQLGTDNNRDGIKKCRSRKAKNTGILRMYPGSSKPWIAVYAKGKLGHFATEEEAIAARAAYKEASPSDHGIGRGLGYSIRTLPSGRVRFKAHANGKYLGCFDTAAEATAARDAYVLAVAGRRAA
jgi:hypothetical protein